MVIVNSFLNVVLQGLDERAQRAKYLYIFNYIEGKLFSTES